MHQQLRVYPGSPRTALLTPSSVQSPSRSGSLQCPAHALGLLVGNPGPLFSKSAVHFLPPTASRANDSRRERQLLLRQGVQRMVLCLSLGVGASLADCEAGLPGAAPPLNVTPLDTKARPPAPPLNLTPAPSSPRALLGQRERLFLEIFASHPVHSCSYFEVTSPAAGSLCGQRAGSAGCAV